MRGVVIPSEVGEYQEVVGQAFPDPLISEHPFYRNLIGWVVDNRTPVFYEADHSSERTNFSINFNWMLLRDYKGTDLGPPDTVQTMYATHEFAHMTHWLPTRLDEISAQEYAEQFTGSEYRASNETEILIHYRVPELRSLVLSGVRTTFDIMREHGIEQPSAAALACLRALVIEGSLLDEFYQTPEDAEELARLKRFSGNRLWAIGRYAALHPYLSDVDLPLGDGLPHHAYEPTISKYESAITQEVYEDNMMRNVRLGYAMCGLAVPSIGTFSDAVIAAKELEGRHAVTHD